MRFHMTCQTFYTGEIFPTEGAGMGFYTCMSPDVYFQVTRHWKRNFTWRANIRLFSCMSSHMYLQSGETTSVVTLGAGIFLVCCVGFHMPIKVSWHGKSLATLVAWEGFLPCVYSTMSFQATRVREGFVTWGAGEGLNSWVARRVFQQKGCKS